MKYLSFFVFILTLTLSRESFAQDGTLDSSFGSNGIVTTDLGAWDNGEGVAVQTDGKITIAGYSYSSDTVYYALTKYNTDGSIDSSFGNDGKVMTYIQGIAATGWNDLMIQSNGTIVTCGGKYLIYILARYNADGSLDSTFGINGIAEVQSYDLVASLTALAIQSDGKIVATGYTGHYIMDTYFWIALVRFNSDGTFDGLACEFSVDTVGFDQDFLDEGLAKAIQEDSKIIVGGVASGKMFVVRFNNDFSRDNSFGANGVVKIGVGNGSTGVQSIAIQSDQKILIAGGSTEGVTLMRLNVDGVLDNSFGQGGKVIMPIGISYEAKSIAVLQDDKIQMVCNDFTVARFNINGDLDSSFGFNGIVTNEIGVSNSMAIQTGGNIVVAGSAGDDFAVARYISSLEVGLIDLSSLNSSILIYPNPITESATLKYTLQTPETISIHLFDVQGKLLKTFIENEKQDAGEHQQEISFPDPLPSGVYFLKISGANGGNVSVKVIK